jgi:putative CocE/NonD family hydrolase
LNVRSAAVALLLSLVGLFSTAPPGSGRDATADGRPTTRSFTAIQSFSQYVTMRDGVRLAVDVHVPRGLAAGERTATILHMSRYYRSIEIRGLWRPFFGGLYPITERDIREAFVKSGYSWVDVDVRGAGASFGHREYPLSAAEVRDGADLLDWIVAQPWSAGVVGATGSSYDGTLASLLLRNRHPALKVVVPRFSGWDVYGDIFLPGGLQATALLRDWARLTAALDRGRLTDVFGWPAAVLTGGVRAVDNRVLPQAMAEHDANVDVERLLRDVVYRDDAVPPGRPVMTDDFSPHMLSASVADVPIYAYAGWFDAALPRGQIRQYLANRSLGSRLRLGPWFHAGEFNASPAARSRHNDFDHAKELIRFFDYHLRGIDNGFGADAPVQYYTMGEERWKSARVWPPPGVRWQSFFLDADRRLAPQASSAESDRDRYRVDETATSGFGSRWGLIVGTGVRRGYKDRRDSDRRLLTYTSPPLRESLEVTGHPIVHLFLKANAADGAVFGYLEDILPDGEVRYVTEGELRLIHRKIAPSPLERDPVPFRSYRRSDSRPMVPGETTDVTFDLLPTSFLFRAGHAIRLAIAGADLGSFAEPISLPPVYDVLHDRSHLSRLDLPTYTPQQSNSGRRLVVPVITIHCAPDTSDPPDQLN